MARNKDGDFLKSALIIGEIKKYPVLYDTGHPSFAERTIKIQCWEKVCASVFPNWGHMTANEKSVNGKDIQKRWRSIRDSYTKQYRAGKCPPPATLPPGGGRRLQHQRHMAFFYDTLTKKNPRPSIEKRLVELDQTIALASTDNVKEEPKIVANQIRLPSIDISEANDVTTITIDTSEVSPVRRAKTPEPEQKEKRKRNIDKSPDVVTVQEVGKQTDNNQSKESEKTKTQKHIELRQREASQKEIELRKRAVSNKNQKETELKRSANQKQIQQAEADSVESEIECIDITRQTPEKVTTSRIASASKSNESMEIKIDSNTVLPEDHFDDDRLFMLSLLPFLKKMDDDMRLTCRIEVLKVIKYALQLCGQNGEKAVVKEEKNSEETDVSRNTSSSSQTSALRMCRKRKAEETPEQNDQPTQRRRGRPRKKEVDTAPPCWLIYSAEEKNRMREERARKRLLRAEPDKDDSDSEDAVYSRVWRRRGRESRAQRARNRSRTRADRDIEEEISRATSVTQLRAENFLKMYNLEPTKKTVTPLPPEVAVKKEPKDA